MFTMYSLKRNKFMRLDHHMPDICLIKRNMYVHVYAICMYACMHACMYVCMPKL